MVAPKRKLVLLVARDGELVNENLRALAQRHSPLGGQEWILHTPPERGRIHLRMLTGERALRLLHHVGSPSHRLDAARDDDLGVADFNGPTRLVDGFQTGATKPIHRRPGHAHRIARE